MVGSDLCDFNDVYIVLKGTITLSKDANREFIYVRNRFLTFKNNAPFKINALIAYQISIILTDNADLDVVMPMYNLLKYRKNYRKATGSLWNYYRDEPNDFLANNYNTTSITSSQSFKYKSSITGKTSNANQEDGENTEQGNTKTKKNLKIVVPLKYLSNFWRTLDMPLINCEVSLTLTWYENCVLTDITTQAARNANPNADPPVQARESIDAPTGAIFQITDTKLYVPLVTLSTENDKKLIE